MSSTSKYSKKKKKIYSYNSSSAYIKRYSKHVAPTPWSGKKGGSGSGKGGLPKTRTGYVPGWRDMTYSTGGGSIQAVNPATGDTGAYACVYYEPHEFSEQAEDEQKRLLDNGYDSVDMVPITSVDEFKEHWDG